MHRIAALISYVFVLLVTSSASAEPWELSADGRRHVYRCYNRALKNQPSLEGKLVLSFALDSSDMAEDVEVKEDRLTEPKVLGCVLKTLQNTQFSPRSGVHELTLTFARPRTIAVWQFENASKNPELDWLSTAIADALTGQLAKLQHFMPVERAKLAAVLEEHALAQSGVLEQDSLVDVGKLLNAELALTGSFVASGERLRIHARLVGMKDGAVLRAAQVDGTIERIFDAVDQLVEESLEALDIELDAALLASARERGPKYNAIMSFVGRAHNAYHGIGEPQSHEKAVELYKKALELDATLAEAHAGLGQALYQINETANLSEGLEHMRRATELDPDFYHAWLVRSYMESVAGNHPAVRECLAELVRLKPSHPHTHFLACGDLSNLGTWEEALWACDETILLLPKSSYPYVIKFMIVGLQGDWARANTLAREAEELLDDPWLASHRAWVMTQHHAPHEVIAYAIGWLQRLQRDHGDQFDPESGMYRRPDLNVAEAFLRIAMAWAYARQGERGSALALHRTSPFAHLHWQDFPARTIFANSELLRFYLQSYWNDVGPVIGRKPPREATPLADTVDTQEPPAAHTSN